MKVFALNAATGEELWKFDPYGAGTKEAGVSRGLTFWSNDKESKIFVCVSYKMYALDAATGKPLAHFGDSGFVDLRKGLRDDKEVEKYFIQNTSPGVIYKDLIIIGSSLGETYLGLPGNIRAYDVHSGQMKWMFNTIPKPGEYGHDTWPKDAYQYAGGCNAWSGLSIDRKRGMVFAATGAPSFDFHGGDRKGNNLFGNSVIALNANTGKHIWHFQVSHHDLWDYDLPSPPNLITLTKNGNKVDAVAQVTKQGFIFLLDRETGKPLVPVVEKEVPASKMMDEEASSTQPFPAWPAPLVRQRFDTNEITNISPDAHDYVLNEVLKYDFGGIYTPPSTKGIVQLPGFRGGAEWSGAAIDQETNVMYVGVNDMANLVQLVELKDSKKELLAMNVSEAGEVVYQQNCSPCHGANRKGNGPYPSLIGVNSRLSTGDINSIVEKGRNKMPAFPHLSAAEKGAVVSFLSGLRTKKTFTEQSDDKEATTLAGKKYKIKGYIQLKDKEGFPGTKPPWGMLKAVDLNDGKLVWSRPLGNYPELAKKGITGTGTQLFGGGVVTKGGLIFIGASKDQQFRAIDKKSGETLWEVELPAGGYATPATYTVAGKQYVVIAAGGGGFQVTKPGDTYLAFALPD